MVECGVPQGTVLGPLSFCVYINELFSLLSKGQIVIPYSGDTKGSPGMIQKALLNDAYNT